MGKIQYPTAMGTAVQDTRNLTSNHQSYCISDFVYDLALSGQLVCRDQSRCNAPVDQDKQSSQIQHFRLLKKRSSYP